MGFGPVGVAVAVGPELVVVVLVSGEDYASFGESPASLIDGALGSPYSPGYRDRTSPALPPYLDKSIIRYYWHLLEVMAWWSRPPNTSTNFSLRVSLSSPMWERIAWHNS